MTSREQFMRGSLALALADLMPPLLRQALIADESFSAGLGLVTDGVVTFNPAGVAFQRSVLLKAVRKASQVADVGVELNDEFGVAWMVRFDRREEPVVVALQAGERVVHVRHLGLVSERVEDRLAMLEAEAARVHLPVAAKERWLALITERPLRDDEVSDFVEDLNNTPIAIAAAIAGTLNQESAHFDVLVPRHTVYYERLVGRWDAESDIKTYADTVLSGFLGDLISFDAEAGLRLGLLLCSHPLVVDRLAGMPMAPDVFDRVARWALEAGDGMARCAVLELALLRDDVLEETNPVLAKVVAGLLVRGGEPDEAFEMLSGAFVFVYGQLAHRKILTDRPSYWRRMAALAESALIARCMAPKRGALVEFAHDLRRTRARPFALQVYADMRLGPLWQAQFAFPVQLRNEFVGRVVSRAGAQEQRVRALGLYDAILGGGDESLRSSVDPLLMYTAGPLEDNVPLVRELSSENLAAVEMGLAEAKPIARSFAPLVNSVFLFRQDVALADKAAVALQRAQYRLEAESSSIFLGTLSGLATCAAVTRSVALADAVFTLIRYYRRFSPGDLDINDAVRIGSIACASREGLSDWALAMGGLMADFAFQSLTREEAGALEIYIRDLCELIPELWATCGPALAAAEAVAA